MDRHATRSPRALEVAARRLAGGEELTLVMRGCALAPVLCDGASVEVAPYTGQLRVGDIVIARIDGRWVVRSVIIWGPQRTSVCCGAMDGTITGWASVDDVVGVVRRIDGRHPQPALRGRRR